MNLVVSSAPIAKMISDEGNLSVLREAVTAVIGPGWQIKVATGAPTAVAPPQPLTTNWESAGSQPEAAASPEAAAPQTAPQSATPPQPNPARRPPMPPREAAPPPPEDDEFGGVDLDDDAIEASSSSGDPSADAEALLINSLGARPFDS